MQALALLNSIITAVRTGTVAQANRMAAVGPPTAPPQAVHSARRTVVQATAGVSPAPAGCHRFVDIGANLLDSMFEGDYRGKQAHPPDIGAVLARAAAAGVERAIVTAGSLDESRAALEFVRAQRAAGSPVQLYCTIGVHPTRSLEFVPPAERAMLEAAMKELADAGDDGATAASKQGRLDALEAELTGGGAAASAFAAHLTAHVAALRVLLEEGIAEGIAVAVGECGLDYDRLHFCPAGVQRLGFEAQLALAASSKLPLFLHNRNTGGDFGSVCAARRDMMSAGGVVHSFDGDAVELEQLLSLGLHIGLNGCSLKTADNLDVAAKVPLSALHLETDAPWCAIKRTHAGHAHTRPLLDPATGAPYLEVKKEKWQSGAVVKDRCEPCHIVHVLEVVSGARRAAAGSAGKDERAAAEEEERVAAAAHANSVQMFWPAERL